MALTFCFPIHLLSTLIRDESLQRSGLFLSTAKLLFRSCNKQLLMQLVNILAIKYFLFNCHFYDNKQKNN